MKKYLIIFVCFLSFMLTGCTTEKDREIVLEQLSKNGYLTKDYVYEQDWCTNASPIPAILSYSYVYSLPDDSKSEIMIYSKTRKKDAYLSCFKVLITSNIEVEQTELGSNSPFICKKSDSSEATELYIVEEKFLIFTHWKIYSEKEYNEKFN